MKNNKKKLPSLEN